MIATGSIVHSTVICFDSSLGSVCKAECKAETVPLRKDARLSRASGGGARVFDRIVEPLSQIFARASIRFKGDCDMKTPVHRVVNGKRRIRSSLLA